MSEKIKKPSQSTVLFWSGLALSPIGAILALIFPSAPWTGILVAVAGAALAGRQYSVDASDHRQELEQERARNKAVAQNEDRHSRERELEENLSRGADALPPTRESETEAQS